MTPTVYSMSTDLETKRIVWTLNNGSNTTGLPSIGTNSATIAGIHAELWKEEALSTIPTFE